mgnify:CR=1 FL=1
MKESVYKNYDELSLFLNSATVAKVLGVSLSSAYELMHEPDFPRRRERHRRQREGGPARGAHGVPAVYRLPAHAQRAFLHQRGPSGSETVRNFNR